MTLIAVACKGDHAEFITDTGTYLPNAREFQRATKFLLLPHLDAAVLCAGPGEFMGHTRTILSYASSVADATFDRLAEDAPFLLARVQEDVGAGLLDQMAGHVILVGYSTSSEAFAAHRYSSFDGFEGAEIGGLFLQPHLWSRGPSEDAAGRATAAETRHLATVGQTDPAPTHAFLDEWEARPPLTMPESLTDWALLAEKARLERSLDGPWGRAFICGQLLYGRLERDSVSVAKIWDFNDDGEEFDLMVAGTDHPRAQAADCACGSGRNILECCRAGDLEKSCGCGSGQTFKECCMAEREEASGEQVPRIT